MTDEWGESMLEQGLSFISCSRMKRVGWDTRNTYIFTYPRRCHTDMVRTMYTICRVVTSQVENLK